MDKTPTIFKLLSDKNRLAMFMMFMHDEYCVCDVERFLALKQANVSKHLMMFRDLDLLSIRKEHQWTHYKMSHEALLEHKQLCQYLINTDYYKFQMAKLEKFEKSICKPKEDKV